MQCIKDTIKNINIVIGCSIGCSYCYARMNNNRFHTIDDFNKPVFFENKLKMLDNKRHTAYLLTGQSDLSGWNEEWKDKVFSKMKENENTQYIFLTKRPENIKLKETPDNGWFGVTVTSSKEKTRIDYLRNNIKANHYHITFEPMFDDVGKLDLNNIAGIVTELGGTNSHVSIMARTHEIPAIVGIKHAIQVLREKDFIAINGTTGEIFVNPTEEECVELGELKEKLKQELQKFKGFWHSIMSHFHKRICYDKDNNYKIVSDDLYKNGIFDDNDNEIANNIYRKVTIPNENKVEKIEEKMI